MKELTIDLKHDYIPITLVEPDTKVKHEFKYIYDDTTLNSYKDEVNPILEKFKEARESNTFEEIDTMLKDGFEFLLGEGEYERIKKVQRSIINRQSLIFDIINLSEDQLSDLKLVDEENKAEKYSVD